MDMNRISRSNTQRFHAEQQKRQNDYHPEGTREADTYEPQSSPQLRFLYGPNRYNPELSRHQRAHSVPELAQNERQIIDVDHGAQDLRNLALERARNLENIPVYNAEIANRLAAGTPTTALQIEHLRSTGLSGDRYKTIIEAVANLLVNNTDLIQEQVHRTFLGAATHFRTTYRLITGNAAPRMAGTLSLVRNRNQSQTSRSNG